MSTGSEIDDYHVSHVQWFSRESNEEKSQYFPKLFCSKRKRSGIATTSSYSIFLFIMTNFVLLFLKQMMRTGTEEARGSWQFEWMTILKKYISKLWRKDFYAERSRSSILWQSKAYVCLPWQYKPRFKERFFQKPSHYIYLSAKPAEYGFWLKSLVVLVFI